MGARSESRAKQAIDTILLEHSSIPQERLVWLPLDLSKLSNVLEAVQILMSQTSRLDILSKFLFLVAFMYFKLNKFHCHSQQRRYCIRELHDDQRRV